MSSAEDILALAGWRRSVAEMYATVRRASDPAQGWRHFVGERDRLFKAHRQSPLSLEQRVAFTGLPYFPYRPEYRVTGRLADPDEAAGYSVELGADGLFRYRCVATIQFELLGQAAQLSLFWVEGYGGGLFLPFKDQTSGRETYGGGRYLYDSVKGADLGQGGGPDGFLLDFNFAYNPSCAYHSRWVCPLSPAENDLPLAIPAGEQHFSLAPS